MPFLIWSIPCLGDQFPKSKPKPKLFGKQCEMHKRNDDVLRSGRNNDFTLVKCITENANINNSCKINEILLPKRVL